VGGARAAVAHLAGVGHTRIAFVGDAPQLFTADQRLRGYREALAEAGLAPDDARVRTGSHDAPAAEAAVRALMALEPARRPTAVFAANNRNTIGALRALRDVRPLVALVGFDDFELADMLARPVTVVRDAPEEMGRIAAELAYGRLAGDDGPPQRRTVACELVVRGSGEVPPP